MNGPAARPARFDACSVAWIAEFDVVLGQPAVDSIAECTPELTITGARREKCQPCLAREECPALLSRHAGTCHALAGIGAILTGRYTQDAREPSPTDD